MTLDMHALILYRLAMKSPDLRQALLPLAAALQRGADKLQRLSAERAAGGCQLQT